MTIAEDEIKELRRVIGSPDNWPGIVGIRRIDLPYESVSHPLSRHVHVRLLNGVGSFAKHEVFPEVNLTEASAVKPPRGIKPRNLWNLERAQDLIAAISRYIEAGLPVPDGWFDELRDVSQKVGE